MTGTEGLKVVVTGATGNVGTSVTAALGAQDAVGSVVGIARRPTDWRCRKTEFVVADVADDDLHELLRDAAAVVHLAWLFQPTHKPEITWRNNVLGSIRVFETVAEVGVPTLVHASSGGAYSPGPQDERVDERWPTHGWPGAAYPREKAYLERWLDTFELRHPDIRVVRMRPGFLFKRESATAQRRLFAGPLLPGRLVRALPVVPRTAGLRMQVLHTDDAADAYVRAVLRPVRGAFNLAAEPPVDAEVLAEILGARTVPVPPAALHAAVAAAWHARLAPASPGLVDTVLRLPLMDCTRARTDLEWIPRFSPRATLEEFLTGLRDGAGLPTPPLAEDSVGRRLHEVATGMGQRP
ncbi:NAD-dependent epimerase/dehydratase family protein [Rhodococcus aetherivorans]|uniref:NAD-dependent epimerase/dehydratase family protein n=1 Tax=Rhodococcus aetherivorans TaxID=191292 RepID=A0AA46NUQ0_9NOCA|nr:NAD-dependent epimerase/dehydratase family protein [Rhodococcus aetherivorans]UGQ43598.1 NAD-dependent epimerase/dehydratase family protein [Rhodococcus aetherivorans]UYF91681.1 NAD-dependent epimerase/dehydratase family protein [Rhodococcus aetherivorans]